MQAVQHRSTGTALVCGAVGVHRDVHGRVERAERRQRPEQEQGVRCRAEHPDRRAQRHGRGDDDRPAPVTRHRTPGERARDQCAQRQPQQRESESRVGEVERALAFGKAGEEARAREAVGDERDDERDGRASHAQRPMPVPPHYRLIPVRPHYRLIIVQRMSVMSAS